MSPEDHIQSCVMERIQAHRALRARISLMINGAIGAIASIACIAAVSQAITTAREVGLFEYASLAWSDSASVWISYKAWTISIAETFPLIEISIALGCALIIVHALRILHRTRSHRLKLHGYYSS